MGKKPSKQKKHQLQSIDAFKECKEVMVTIMKEANG